MEQKRVSDKRVKLAQCNPEDEIVISGISGVYPKSNNVREFGENLLAKKNLISDTDEQFKAGGAYFDYKCGKLTVPITKFDAEFFRCRSYIANKLSPMTRMLLEKTFEAILDAGYNPKYFIGSNTGVYVGLYIHESGQVWAFEKETADGYGFLGNSRFIMANRITHWFGFIGPSYPIDTACSSSISALECAYRDIRNGTVDSAVVAGCNLCLNTALAGMLCEMGAISKTGSCKSFDESADGYCRSESIAVILIQKKKDARRMYANVVYVKTNSNGHRAGIISDPSDEGQADLFQKFYEECGVDPTVLKFVEAHATGTREGDVKESTAIDKVFCPGRKEPLRVGSVKSNMGHAEAASGICSMTKMILAFELGILPPNIHYKTPRADIDALQKGRLVVLTEPTPWDVGLVGINSFGLGGVNGHTLFSPNYKTKVNNGLPADDLPRLVVASGRSEEAVDIILSDFENRPIDVEYIRLMHQIHVEDVEGHNYRGYTLLKKDKQNPIRHIEAVTVGETRPVWFVFSGVGTQWTAMGKSMLDLPLFRESIEKCHKVIESKNMNLIEILTNENPECMKNIYNLCVGITSVQIALCDVLTALGIKPEGMLGHSIGEIGCAYADGCLTLEQAMLISYYRGKALTETKLIQGAMASIGLSYDELKDMVPSDIDIACHNAPNNCTISGPAAAVKDFMNILQEKKVFVREVNSSNIPYHSRYLTKAAAPLMSYAEQIVPEKKLRSAKWISTSNSESSWNMDEVKYSCAKYYVNNLLHSVYFDEACRRVPSNAIAIEIAPHGLLQAILKRTFGSDVTNVPLMARNHAQNMEYFLCALGRIFESGANAELYKLYPPVEFPVSRGTPMIAPLIKWEHSKDWFVTNLFAKIKKSAERTVSISILNPEMEYLTGHVIDNRNLYPAAGYLMLVWETLAMMHSKLFMDFSVIFENVKFVRATVIPREDEIELKILLHKSNGYFEVTERDTTVVTGNIYKMESAEEEFSKDEKEVDSSELPLNGNDIYKEYRLRGYGYEGVFKGISSSNFDGTLGRIKWENNFVPFLDCIFQMCLFETDWRKLFVPTGIKKIAINVKQHSDALSKLDPEKPSELNVYADKEMKTIKCGGIVVDNLKFTGIARKKVQNEPNLERVVFVPFISQWSIGFSEAIRMCAEIIGRNLPTTTLKIVELVDEYTRPDRNLIAETLGKIYEKAPLVQTNIVVVFDKSDHPMTAKKLPPEISVSFDKVPSDRSKSIMVVTNLLKRKEILPMCFNCLEDNGFVLAIESADDNVAFKDANICYNHLVEGERFLILKKPIEQIQPFVVKITDKSYSWIPEVQDCLKMIKTEENKKLLLFSEMEKYNGILGLVMCLIKEAGIAKIRCVSIMDDTAPPFSTQHSFYKSQLSKDLVLNVYKDGKWGMYVNLPLEISTTIKTPYAMANTMTVGDLSTLRWMEGPLNPMTYKSHENHTLVHVHYSALNFRDVMLASGKIPRNAVVKSRLDEEFVQGMEYSGKTADGQRVMGIVPAKAMATFVDADVNLMWPVPDNWTLEEAATVPVVYSTVLYALLLCGQMKKGCSILIHAGSGGVGQAAIYVCLYYNCTIFTTVGTQEKREFIRKTFPSIPDNHIGNSRDTSFEKMIMKETNGRGVDIVLNSLAEEKLQASVNCLAHGGQFLEIGLYDLVMNNPLGMGHFLKEISFRGIELANLFHADPSDKRKLKEALQEFIGSGCVKPLTRAIFPANDIEAAFRFMAGGKHIGKVLLKMREEESSPGDKVKASYVDALPRYSCSENKCYVICGGLGGMGLELVDWLVIRGARKLVISSKRGITTGYQEWRIRLWKSYGANIIISTEDIAQEEGVEKLLQVANSLGPVSAIFNLAVRLEDALFENYTEETFKIPFEPKAIATFHLDRVSRKLCRNLEQFVIFSSITSNYGNAGQTNYSMANSVMERICEQRQLENLPALAIESGPIGDVGLLGDAGGKERVIGGMVTQSVFAFLDRMDYFLKQQHPITLCATVAEKRARFDQKRNILDIVADITGIKNVKNININSTLTDYGLDSMAIVELAQTFEREFDVFFTPQDLKTMTFAKLYEMQESITQGKGESKPTKTESTPVEIKEEEEQRSQIDTEFHNLIKSLKEVTDLKPSIVRLPSSIDAKEEASGQTIPTIFLLPGFDGAVKSMECLSSNLKARVYGICYGYNNLAASIQECAKQMVKFVTDKLAADEEFYITGYSYGALVAIEMAKLLESKGRSGLLYLIDPIPDFVMDLRKKYASGGESAWNELKKQVVVSVLDNLWPDYPKKVVDEIPNFDDWNSIVNLLTSSLPAKLETNKEYFKLCLQNGYFRIRGAALYEISHSKMPLKSMTTVINPSKNVFRVDEDNNWSQYFNLPLNVRTVESNYFKIMAQAKTADIIMVDVMP